MEDKIRQLTDKLYEEGLQKGKAESDKMISDAKQKVEEMIADAQKKSAEIIANAKKRDSEMAVVAMDELNVAAQKVVSDSREAVKNMLSTMTISEDTKAVFNNNDFVGGLIASIVENWSKQDPNSAIAISIPESSKQELDKFIASRTFENLKKGIEIKTDSKVLNGFRIASDKTGFYIGFSDEQFNNFFNGYLREKVSQIIFGQK